MKNQRTTFVYLLFIALIIILIVLIVNNIKNNKVPAEKYQPFAFLPEISLSESPNFMDQNILSKTLGLPSFVVDQEMLHGKYERYPLNRKMQTTSVVAVSATQDNPRLIAWLAQVSADMWNFVWPAPANYYWATLVDTHAAPVVVIKGKYPRCRYFSIISYSGLEFGEDGKSYMGQGINKDGSASCNPTIPGDCAGLLDKDIEPDPGSKNPFRDASYKEGEDNFYTLYFISPYYKGALPASKNILPLTVRGLNQSCILYRIYAPFNPKSCDSPIYSSQLPFSTEGCPADAFPISTDFGDGGSAHPEFDKSSPCTLMDKVCMQDCVNYEMSKNLDPDCYQYVNNNKYCVCEPENYYGKCGQYLDATIRKCSNGKGGLANFCEGRPTLNKPLDYCVRKIPLNPDIEWDPQTGMPNCPIPLIDGKEKDPVCDYVKTGLAAECLTEKLFESDNMDCNRFKDPSKVGDICNDDPNKKGTCAYEFKDYLGRCYFGCSRDDKSERCLPFPDNPNFTAADAAWFGYCQNQKKMKKETPPYAYQPTYDFVEYPKQCGATCDRYTCANGYCVPNINGEYDNPSCDNKCERVTPAPTHIPDHHRRSHHRPTSPPHTREDFVAPTPGGKPCPNRFLATDCDLGKKPFRNTNQYYVNAENQKLSASSGWVGLPDVFIKYSYNNYFVRLHNSDQIENQENLLATLKAAKNSMQYANGSNPLDPFLVERQNPSVNIQEYAESVRTSKESFEYPTRKPEEDMCPKYVDSNTYLTIGAQYPKRTLTLKKATARVNPPGCNYYADLCACENNGKKNAGPCNVVQKGFVNCKGEPCFKRWGLKTNRDVVFTGEAKSFAVSANTADTIIFPNPDSAYLACATTYDPDSVYVVWMDVPTTPLTPGYKNIVGGKYDMRYWSLSHNYWSMGLVNQRPLLSGLFDQQFKTVDVQYADDETGKCVKGKRACVLLASYEQYEYLKTYHLLDERINWVNWGKVRLSLSKPLMPTPSPDEQAFYDEVNTLQSYGIDINEDPSSGTRDLKSLIQSMHTPKDGLLVLRHLSANESFTQSITAYVSGNPDCLNNNIPLKQSEADAVAHPPKMVSKSCNPGNQDECDEYGLDPCCLSTDLLSHMKQYYPRCETVKICDIENIGAPSFWEKYLTLPLPYLYDAHPSVPVATCSPQK